MTTTPAPALAAPVPTVTRERMAWLRADHRAPHEFARDVPALRAHAALPDLPEEEQRLVSALLDRWAVHEQREEAHRQAQAEHRARACALRGRTNLPHEAGLHRMRVEPLAGTSSHTVLVHFTAWEVDGGRLTATLLDPVTLDRRAVEFALDGAGRTLVPHRGWEVIGFEPVL